MVDSAKIDELVNQLESQYDETKCYFNKTTHEIYMFIPGEVDYSFDRYEQDEDDLRIDGLDARDEFVKKDRMTRKSIVESDDWIELPTKFEVHEWSIMDLFAISQENSELSDRLTTTLRQRKAFRSFKDLIIAEGIEKQWYAFRERAFRRTIIEWLEYNEIPYNDERAES